MTEGPKIVDRVQCLVGLHDLETVGEDPVLTKGGVVLMSRRIHVCRRCFRVWASWEEPAATYDPPSIRRQRIPM